MIQREEYFYDLPAIERYVHGVGSELEGAYDTDRGLTLVHDSSVEVACNDRDDCCCSDYCECEGCHRCSECGDTCEDCMCDDCRVCTECDTQIFGEHCTCIVYPTAGCAECTTEEGVCSDCYASWRHDHVRYDCVDAGHSQLDCDPVECGCCDCSSSELEDGERVSPVLQPSELPQWVIDNYPDEVNDSCGAHLHVSTDMLTYSILLDPKFLDFVISESKAWRDRANIKNESFNRRLNNLNTYCKTKYDAGNQVTSTEHYYNARYTAVNYCYRLHGTLEFRIPPAFKQARITAKYYCLLLSLIPKFVKNYKTESYIGTIQ